MNGSSLKDGKLKIRDKRRKNYFDIDNVFVKNYARHLGVVGTAVYAALSMHSDYHTQRCWPAMETIAEELGIERHTVSRALAKLEKWNIIHIGRSIDRKGRKRKNNVYTLLSKEEWVKLPIEGENAGAAKQMLSKESRGIETTMGMVSKVPSYGIENASNNPPVIKPPEPTYNSGSLPTILLVEEGPKNSPKANGYIEREHWSPERAMWDLVYNDSKDLKIIGKYFMFRSLEFSNARDFNSEIHRNLKAASILKKYPMRDIEQVMERCEEAYGHDLGWSLEAVVKRLDT